MNTSRTTAVAAALLASIALTATSASAADVEYGRMAKNLPSNGEMNRWIRDLWSLGVHDTYGYRMPGTVSDSRAADYVLARFKAYGLVNRFLEPVPATFSFPETWTLEVNGEAIPCHFLRYVGFTPPGGVTAPLVYVGTGSEAEFEAAGDVAGKIVLVDILAPPTPASAFDPATLFRYDPDHTLVGDNAMENWPPINFDTYDRAHAKGAIGYVAVLTFTVDDNDQFLHYYFSESIPGVSVSPPVGVHLKTLVAAGPVDATIALTGTRTDDGTIYNVYGTLPGKNYGTDADRFIVVESHYDGWAANEGSGTSVVLAIAQYLSKLPKESRNYSVVFCTVGSHFGKKASWEAYGSYEYQLVQQNKVKCAFVVEMISKQFKIVDGAYVSTGLVSPRGLMVNARRLVPIASAAIVKYQLDRTLVLYYFNGETAKWNEAGVTVVGHISENATQFTSADTPETVMVDALRPTTAAFVDMIQAVDASF